MLPSSGRAASDGGVAERAARMFKALGDPVRLRLLYKIGSRPGGEACVCEIADVGVARTTVSHHLKRLREAGLSTSERRGTQVYYQVARSAVETLAEALGSASQAPPQ
jgi:ArsR family transcriptional regulator